MEEDQTEEGMKEIQRYDWTPDGMWGADDGNSVKYADHLAAIEEAKKEERERILRFSMWWVCNNISFGTSKGVDEAFVYWQSNIEPQLIAAEKRKRLHSMSIDENLRSVSVEKKEGL